MFFLGHWHSSPPTSYIARRYRYFGPRRMSFSTFSRRRVRDYESCRRPPANGASPYSSTSAFAGNPLLISWKAAEHGWIDHSRTTALQGDGCSSLRAGFVSKLRYCAKPPQFPGRASVTQIQFENFCRGNSCGWKTSFF